MNRKFFSLFFAFIISVPVFSQQGSAISIIVNKCTPCHNKSGDAPFSLATYPEVKKRLNTIKTVVETGYMPPWKADNNYCSYSNDKSLNAEEKKSILDWIANGAKNEQAGIKNTNALSPAKSASVSKADSNTIIIKSDFRYGVKGDNTERFVLFKLPFEYDREYDIDGIEFLSDNKRVVHHVNYGVFSVNEPHIDIKAGSKFIETDNSNSNQAEYDPLTGRPMYYTGWIPGSSGEKYLQNFGWVMPKRGVIIFTVHFSAIPVDESFEFGIRLHVGNGPIQRKIKIISFGSGGVGERDITPDFVIQPDKLNSFELKMLTKSSQSVMYVWPHMHLLGKAFKAYAVTPKKDTIRLISIPQWDYRWQELYRMKQLTYIPAGSILVMEGIYDNTQNNPLNPNNPPQTILPTKNMESTKEMFTLLMIYVPYKPGDENIKLD